jgi:RHS repeat-associated protein
VKDAFSYDGYGVMLGANPANAATSLLYTGEMYDSSASMYYLRARWYDQQTGRFNRMDPFAQNNHDPLSWDYRGQRGTGCPSKKNLGHQQNIF